MMKGQIHEQEKDIYEARQAYRNGVCINYKNNSLFKAFF